MSNDYLEGSKAKQEKHKQEGGEEKKNPEDITSRGISNHVPHISSCQDKLEKRQALLKVEDQKKMHTPQVGSKPFLTLLRCDFLGPDFIVDNIWMRENLTISP